jgi:hypothetical protein
MDALRIKDDKVIRGEEARREKGATVDRVAC